MQNFLLKLLLHGLIILSHHDFANSSICDRIPDNSANRSPPDGRYKLRILGDPDHFTPGENYTSESVKIRHIFKVF
jgi:hypothetical protein